LAPALAAAVLLLGAGLTTRADDASVARGAYLAASAGCDQCHTDTADGGGPYAGGRKLVTEFGTIRTPNITPDRDTGIGRWSAADFTRAMRYGLAPDGSHYVPAFPFRNYGRLTDRDLADVKAFLDSLPSLSRPNLGAADSLALAQRAWAAVGVWADGASNPWQPDPTRDPVIERGAYLVATLGRCDGCHTPRTWLGAPDMERQLTGYGRTGPNLTPDPEHGIGKWSEDDIITLLKEGQEPDGDFVGGAMVEIVRNTTRLNDADRKAIAAFLRSLPAKPLGKKS
jgi:mono/diheme cytochrome c family protein